KELTGRYAYYLMLRCQQLVDVPTWLGAYEKAVAEGNAEDRAVALADQAVRDAQGGGQVSDLSAVERSRFLKLFTVFYSFMNTALNLGVGQTMTAKTPAQRGKLAADYLLLYVVPPLLGAAIKDALTPGDSGDWDEWETALRRLLQEQLGFLLGLMVITREFGQAAQLVGGRPQDYSGPTGLRFIPDIFRFTQQAAQGEFDDAFRKASINLLGDAFALPAAQVNRTITGVQALNEGETVNPAALVFGFQRH
ncbi:MAG: hypothetical protein MK041_03205, partial [Aquabacterium sp.]|nr:hypothetical protein [Aquabacterium sp.]